MLLIRQIVPDGKICLMQQLGLLDIGERDADLTLSRQDLPNRQLPATCSADPAYRHVSLLEL